MKIHWSYSTIAVFLDRVDWGLPCWSVNNFNLMITALVTAAEILHAVLSVATKLWKFVAAIHLRQELSCCWLCRCLRSQNAGASSCRTRPMCPSTCRPFSRSTWSPSFRVRDKPLQFYSFFDFDGTGYRLGNEVQFHQSWFYIVCLRLYHWQLIYPGS